MSQVTSDRNGQGIMLYAKVNRKRRIKFFQLKSRFIFQKDLDNSSTATECDWISDRINYSIESYCTPRIKISKKNKTRNRIWKFFKFKLKFFKMAQMANILFHVLLHNFASIDLFILGK